ncbi:MAG: RHS repeat-associated core domain-containing protein [Bacteroidia bacterium]|nr:RHS repeat-associated core domain-containing protein [Bacteroidia bacterium]
MMPNLTLRLCSAQAFSDLTNKVDLTTTTTNEVLQENHYYPFGLSTNGAWMNSATSLDNLYQYNGKELNADWGLNMIDYGARMYMADLGRWGGVDPMPVSYVSTYAYVHNAPLALLDPTGMYAEGSSHSYTDADASVRRRMDEADDQKKQEKQREALYEQIQMLLASTPTDPPLQKRYPVYEGDGMANHASIDITAYGASTIYDKWTQVAYRRRMGLAMSHPGESKPLTYWTYSYDNYLTGKFSPGHWQRPDAFGIQVSGSFIWGGGKSASFGAMNVIHEGGMAYGNSSGGLGLDVSAGISIWGADFHGPAGQPSYGGLMGLGYMYAINAGPFSFYEFGDLGIDPLSNKFSYGANWKGWGFGIGASPSSLAIPVSGTVQVGYSYPLIRP